MKKCIRVFSLVSLFLLSGGIISCDNSDNTSLLITEVVEGTAYNQAVELYNRSQKEIDLSDYSLGIYYNKEVNPKKIIELSGIVEPNTTYVISNPDANKDIKLRSNVQTEDLFFRGYSPIALLKNGKIIDVVGSIGHSYNEFMDVSLVRKNYKLTPKIEWNEYDWIRYGKDNFKYLGNVENSVTEAELLEGPKIDKKYFSMPLFQDSWKKYGAGGLLNCEFKCIYSGEKINLCKKDAGNNLDCFDVKLNCISANNNDDKIDEWETSSEQWLENELKDSKGIRIQTEIDFYYNNIFDGFVWVNNKLLNYELVKLGLANYSCIDEVKNDYKDIPYSSWIYDAELYAKENKKGKFGEKDPNWNYDENKPISLENTIIN